jgi:hypothetical protein
MLGVGELSGRICPGMTTFHDRCGFHQDKAIDYERNTPRDVGAVQASLDCGLSAGQQGWSWKDKNE